MNHVWLCTSWPCCSLPYCNLAFLRSTRVPAVTTRSLEEFFVVYWSPLKRVASTVTGVSSCPLVRLQPVPLHRGTSSTGQRRSRGVTETLRQGSVAIAGPQSACQQVIARNSFAQSSAYLLGSAAAHTIICISSPSSWSLLRLRLDCSPDDSPTRFGNLCVVSSGPR